MADAFDERIRSLDAKLRKQKNDDFKGRVHHEDEVYHDTKGKLHYDKEACHDTKGKIFHDPRSDYDYCEERMNVETAAFSEQTRSKAELAPQRVKKRFKNPALVQGLIMSEVLQKPRALRPYNLEDLG